MKETHDKIISEHGTRESWRTSLHLNTKTLGRRSSLGSATSHAGGLHSICQTDAEQGLLKLGVGNLGTLMCSRLDVQGRIGRDR